MQHQYGNVREVARRAERIEFTEDVVAASRAAHASGGQERPRWWGSSRPAAPEMWRKQPAGAGIALAPATHARGLGSPGRRPLLQPGGAAFAAIVMAAAARAGGDGARTR